MGLVKARSSSAIPSEAAVLSQAVANAARIWSLSNDTLGKIIGVSAATSSRLRSGSWTLERGTKQFELGQFFVRLFRSLDSIVGSDDDAAVTWLKSENSDLNDRPIDMIVSVKGLAEVSNYVDDFRGRA